MVKRSTRQEVYEAIKGMLRDGEFRPGARIEAGVVAMQLHVSASPVRDALHTLAGEQLVQAHAHEGFSAPSLTEGRLRELYLWQRHHVLSAVDMGLHQPLGAIVENLERALEKARVADATAQVFAALVRQTTSAEMLRSVTNVNERLAWPRHLETHLLGHMADELLQIYDTWIKQDAPSLKRLLVTYFDRRLHIIPDLVRLLYEAPTSEVN